MKVAAILSVGLCAGTVIGGPTDGYANLHAYLRQTGNPLHIFISGGQSECKGYSSYEAMVEDADSRYDIYKEEQNFNVVTTIKWTTENEWTYRFMSPQWDKYRKNGVEETDDVSAEGKFYFGPEVSFTHQYFKLTGDPALVIKSCHGGTSVFEDWNPNTNANKIPEGDDGSSNHIKSKVDYTNSKKSYINMIYTIRKTVERLNSGNYNYKFMGILWNQGQSDRTEYTEDKEASYKFFANNTMNTLNGIREKGAGIVNLPIIDSGADNPATPPFGMQLSIGQSGKRYAYANLNGCNTVGHNYVPNQDNFYGYELFEGIDKNLNPLNPVHNELFNFQILVDNFEELNSTFTIPKTTLYVNFPLDMHSEYVWQIEKGVSLANRYLLEWRPDVEVPAEELERDIVHQFPLEDCGPDVVVPDPFTEADALLYVCIDELREGDDLSDDCIISNEDSLPLWEDQVGALELQSLKVEAANNWLLATVEDDSTGTTGEAKNPGDEKEGAADDAVACAVGASLHAALLLGVVAV